MNAQTPGPGLTPDELKQLLVLLRKCGTFKLSARVDKPEVRALLADVERWAPIPPTADQRQLGLL